MLIVVLSSVFLFHQSCGSNIHVFLLAGFRGSNSPSLIFISFSSITKHTTTSITSTPTTLHQDFGVITKKQNKNKIVKVSMNRKDFCKKKRHIDGAIPR